MYFEAVFSFYVLLYHFVGHSFFGLIAFRSFSNIIKWNFSLTLAKLNFYVDMSVWLFVGKQYYRLGMLIDVEYSNRKNNRLKRLIRQAEFEQPDASIAAIDYHSGRKLNKALINRLATCEYITEYRNIFITGATGSGKTYMACAFGMEACKRYYSVRYVRLPDLLLDLQTARDNGTFATVLKKYTKPIVLIIDEWLLLKLTEAEARNLFELIHKRRKKSSTIFCSQFRESEWYQQICDGESTLADAIMDRISYDSYKIDIESVDPSKDLSMREIYGLDPAMAK